MYNIARLIALVFAISGMSNISVEVSAQELTGGSTTVADAPAAQPGVVVGDSSATKSAPVAATVTIDSFQFKPSQVKIKKGSNVAFVNNDPAAHTVSPFSSNDFTGTGRLLKGERKVVIFDHAGKFKYFCDFHPSMEGVVVVTE